MTDMGQEIKYVLSLWTTIVTWERADADIIQGERNQWLTECLNLANDCANHCLNCDFILMAKSGTFTKEFASIISLRQ